MHEAGQSESARTSEQPQLIRTAGINTTLPDRTAHLEVTCHVTGQLEYFTPRDCLHGRGGQLLG
jgi:hypothetical protein